MLASAYPWIARRLLSDKSTDLQDTLRALLYKQNKCAHVLPPWYAEIPAPIYVQVLAHHLLPVTLPCCCESSA